MHREGANNFKWEDNSAVSLSILEVYIKYITFFTEDVGKVSMAVAWYG